LTRGQRLEHPVVAGLADKYQRSSAQILVHWALQHEVVAIRKATTRSHIHGNISVFDFSISPSDRASLDSLNENLYLCRDPSGV
jgi:diketogulonate reductase-like aldo/keto reductase